MVARGGNRALVLNEAARCRPASLMAGIRVRVWNKREADGEPDVEVKVPASLAKWVPRMMAFVPRKASVEMWGEDFDADQLFSNLEELVKEVTAKGETEVADVRTKESHVKVSVVG